jgi:hypothetical protein
VVEREAHLKVVGGFVVDASTFFQGRRDRHVLALLAPAVFRPLLWWNPVGQVQMLRHAIPIKKSQEQVQRKPTIPSSDNFSQQPPLLHDSNLNLSSQWLPHQRPRLLSCSK